MYQRLSLADAQVHPRYVCQDDKRTTPPSRRPIPRTPEVDQVIDAVFDLRRAALEKLRALGSRDADLPHLLRGDRPDQSLFIQLKMQSGTGERVRVTVRAGGWVSQSEVIERPEGGAASLVFELGFEGLNASPRHKSGIAVRFPRMLRIRDDKPLHEADTLGHLETLLSSAGAVTIAAREPAP